jgi:serine/threonine-protein kinase
VLRGDLDAIVLKAMSRDPARRYASISSLAADLRRHLGGAPVQARPDGLGRRVGAFLRRRGSAIAVAVTAALLGIVASVGLIPRRKPMDVAPDTGIRVAIR